ncbi:kinesin light chain [Byssothecium circinans]|uniref:Kinesin light chain n=1 Tax=Byssothecium circinans TaxID=147558 RepID=A0A6A5TQR0_9PLEO|nr:kinesin light chain [Byssothecium circinans]
MANLASTYRKQGRWIDAGSLDVQVMETRKTKLGADHPHTLSSMANLRNQGRWKEAEELGVQVMETRKRVLGDEHTFTLTSMNNLAFTLKGKGLTDKAISLMEECSKPWVVVMGSQHPNTISSREALIMWQLEAVEFSEQNNS